MKKNHTNLLTPSLFSLSIYEIIYAALFKDYQNVFLSYKFSTLIEKYVSQLGWIHVTVRFFFCLFFVIF